jgi:hypothetical protein
MTGIDMGVLLLAIVVIATVQVLWMLAGLERLDAKLDKLLLTAQSRADQEEAAPSPTPPL